MKVLHRLAGLSAGLVAFLLAWTYRRSRIGEPLRQKAHEMSQGGILYGVLHEHLFHAAQTHPEKRVVAMVSQSEDGNVLAAMLGLFRITPSRGSSSRGGREALSELHEWIDRGESCCITIDGPRGPRRKAKAGIIHLSRTTGRPILPAAVVASRVWRFRSWDRCEIAKPFARLVHVYGEPFIVREDGDFEAAKRHLETTLEELDIKGRKHLGRPEDFRREG